MTNFQFRLDAALRLRTAQERIREIKLKEVLSGISQLDVRLKLLDSQLTERSSLTATVSATELTHLGAWEVQTKRRIAKMTADARQLRSEAAIHAKELTSARQKVKVLRNLRNDAFQDWQRSLMREQEQLAAELHLAKAASVIRS